MPSAQGHITVRRRAKDGTDGSDAVRYWVIPSATQVKRAQDGTMYPNTVTCEKRKQSGDSAPVVTSEGILYYQIGYNDGSMTARSTYGSTGIRVTSAMAWIKFMLDVSQVQVASETVSVVIDGIDGDDGAQGIQGCIYRRSRFATGFQYRNDSTLKTDGLRYLDLVYLMTDSSIFASKAKWFRCRKTHTSNSSNAPQLTSDGTEAWLEYWEPLNSLEPTYTPFLMADDAIITLMQSNQLLIENDDGVITAGLSGSNSGKKIRIWAGSATPDNAPFRVDVTGALVATKADITGTINATSGKIAGFNISGNSLTNGPEFNNDACIIFRNDTHHTFAGIGGNVLSTTSGLRAVARFENEDYNDFWGIGRNIALYLSAKNGNINHAFIGSGNGNLDGWIGGYKYSKFNLITSNTIYNGYLKISENNVWVVYSYSSVSGSGVVLPTLTEVRTALGIGTSTKFCVLFTIIADLYSSKFWVYGRNKLKDKNDATPWNTDKIPVLCHWNNGRDDRIEMGPGDSMTLLLMYDSSKTGALNDFSLKYTARRINHQS